MGKQMNQVVIKDFWTSEKVLSRLYNSKMTGSVIANKLFGEPLKTLLIIDEAYLLFTQHKVNFEEDSEAIEKTFLA